MKQLKGFLVFAALLFLAPACGDGTPGAGDPNADEDGDGHTVGDGDCDDLNFNVHPDAPDPCDGIDNDCNGVVDDLFDMDEDGYTTCGGDCRDNDETSNPGAFEIIDGFDNDCDGIADNHTESFDDDGDGYSEDQGDCNANEEGDGALVGPDAIEVQLDSEGMPEGLDNDCDGMIDEAILPCPTDLPATDPMAFTSAIELCHQVLEASWDDSLDARSRGIFSDYGDVYVPKAGDTFAALATGIAGDVADTGIDYPSTDLAVSTDHPDPQGPNGCSEADPATVNDYSELHMVLQVPANAKAFAFDFNFMSVEFPEFVCTLFDDTFIAYLESEAFTGNVSFDAMGNVVSINVGFFDVCDPVLDGACNGDADLAGTGYENSDAGDGGGTGWLTTTAPVVPGEKIRLTFAIFDEGDHILDSAVLIDNFRWELEEVDGPTTVEKVNDAGSGRFVTAEPAQLMIR